MKDLFKIIKKIQATSSRNEKELILSAHKNNKRLRNLLNNVFNPYLIFGIKEKKLNKFIKTAKGIDPEFQKLDEVFEYLKINNTGSNAVVEKVAEFLMTEWDEDIREFMFECITKKLKIGATAKSINKSFGEQLIPEFSVMLAKKFEDHEHKIKGEFGVTLKLDGIRCLVAKENGVIKFFTRQGQSIDEMNELIEDFDKLPDNMIYDGELLVVNKDNLSSDDLFRATQKVVRTDGVKCNVEFHMFDLLPISEFKSGKSKKNYADRMLDLHVGLDSFDAKFIKKVPMLYWGNSKSKIFEMLDEVVADGKEGLMVSNGMGYYENKRSDNLLKVKKMHTFDLEIIGVEEGIGKNRGKLGALLVDYKGYSCGVGSGFTDLQREDYWESQDELIGRVAEIQYFEESSNQNGGLSLRFPVFKFLRSLGKEVSYD